MYTINLDCLSEGRNTGTGNCPADFGLPLATLATPRGSTFTLDEVADILNTFKDRAQNRPASARIYPLGGRILAITDNTTDTTFETTDYGDNIPVRAGVIDWTFRLKVNFCLYRGVKKFQNQTDAYDYVFIFQNGVIGTVKYDATTGEALLAGVRLSMLDVPVWKPATGSTAMMLTYRIQVSDSSQLTTDLYFAKTDSNIADDITGIQDVNLSGSANLSPTGTFDISALTSCGGENLATTLGTALADIDLWTAENEAGEPIDIEGVTVVNGKYRVALDEADPNYPDPGDPVIFSFTDVETLFAAGILGYESGTVSIDIPTSS